MLPGAHLAPTPPSAEEWISQGREPTPEKDHAPMLKGFKDFLMRGNVVDLAVAVIIAGAFGKVIEAFVTIVMDIIGKLGGQPDFSAWAPGGVHLGSFITVTISFLIIAAAVYSIVVVPLNKLAERRKAGEVVEDEAPSAEVALLTEIRDALRTR